MLSILNNCWPLFLGMGLIMLGNGLQSSLLGVRASLEGFSTSATGLMMSGYFLGLIFGCRIVPRMVNRVGHIRIFGALASLASTSILIQAIFVEPFIWWVMRLITGFAYAGLYVVVESWLNDASTNKTRGKLFSIYMLVSFAGMTGGQVLLNLASPTSFELFIIVSAMISLAVIPILVSVTPAPQFEVMERISIIQIYRVSPLGVFGMLIAGMEIGAIYGVGSVYATSIGLSVREISIFMGMIILGGFLFQYPLGWLSDHTGRRRVISLCSVAGASLAFFAAGKMQDQMSFFLISMSVGGLSLPLYALCSVHTNDYLNPTQMVAASGTLVLVNSIGATIGSPLTALAMDLWGPRAFFASIGTMLLSITIFSLWRSLRRREVESEEKGEFVVMATSPLTASLNPDVQLDELVAAVHEDAEEIKTSFDELVSELEQAEE